MTDNKLSTKEILELKARAHHLHPVVMVGQQGLTESVIKETDAALTAHELIKVRVFGDDRAERVEICNALCEAVDAQLVQHIGKLLVLWRKNLEVCFFKSIFRHDSYQVFLLCARKIRKIDKLSKIDYCQWEHTRSF